MNYKGKKEINTVTEAVNIGLNRRGGGPSHLPFYLPGIKQLHLNLFSYPVSFSCPDGLPQTSAGWNI